MKLIEFAHTIKRPVFVEIRPVGEYVVGFGVDCVLMSPGKKHEAVHGRGPCLICAIDDLTRILNRTEKPAFLKFPPSYDLITTHTVPDLEYGPIDHNVVVDKGDLDFVLDQLGQYVNRGLADWEKKGCPENHVYLAIKRLEAMCWKK